MEVVSKSRVKSDQEGLALSTLVRRAGVTEVCLKALLETNSIKSSPQRSGLEHSPTGQESFLRVP